MLQAFVWVSEWKIQKNDFFVHKSHEQRTLICFPFKLLCLIVSQHTLKANQLFNQCIPSGRTYVIVIWVGVRVENSERRLSCPQIAWMTHLDPLSFYFIVKLLSQYTLDANWLLNWWILSCRTYVTGVWVGVRVEKLENRLFCPQIAWTTHLDPLFCQNIVSNSKSLHFRRQLVVQSMNSEQ